MRKLILNLKTFVLLSILTFTTIMMTLTWTPPADTSPSQGGGEDDNLCGAYAYCWYSGPNPATGEDGIMEANGEVWSNSSHNGNQLSGYWSLGVEAHFQRNDAEFNDSGQHVGNGLSVIKTRRVSYAPVNHPAGGHAHASVVAYVDASDGGEHSDNDSATDSAEDWVD